MKSTGVGRRFRALDALGGSVSCCDDFLAADGAVEGVDQRLHLDELAACPLGRIAVERRGQHLRMSVPVLDHTLAGFLQRFKSSAHSGTFACFSITVNRMISVETGRNPAV